MFSPFAPNWQFSTSNALTPAQSPGTSVTPGNNTKGSWVEILSDTLVTTDCFGIFIMLHANAVSAAARDTIVDIGFDPAGGTSWSVLIPDLLCSCAIGTSGGGQGVCYFFPLFIKAGTALAARASINNATVGTLLAYVEVYGKPKRPEVMRVGRYVTALGIVAASSRGTAATPGTSGAEGSYVSLGTPTKPHWWWQCGMGVNDGTMTAGAQLVDIAAGDATTKDIILLNEKIFTFGNESISKMMRPHFAYCREVTENIEIWGRISNSLGTNDAAYSVAAYGLGG